MGLNKERRKKQILVSKGGKMNEMMWNIVNVDRDYERVEELERAIKNFPESPMVPFWESEIRMIKQRIGY